MDHILKYWSSTREEVNLLLANNHLLAIGSHILRPEVKTLSAPLSQPVSLELPVFFSLHLEGVFQPVEQFVRELTDVLLLSERIFFFFKQITYTSNTFKTLKPPIQKITSRQSAHEQESPVSGTNAKCDVKSKTTTPLEADLQRAEPNCRPLSQWSW